jgi:putative endopeptidase
MRKYFLLIMATSACCASIISCKSNSSSSANSGSGTDSARGLSVQFIDSAVKPGDNFFMFANGKWYDTATISPTESRAGARIEMDIVAKAHLKSILEETAAAKNTAATIEQKVGDLYAAGMDTARIEKLGYDPIKPVLQQIDAIKDTKSLLQFVAQQTTENNGSLIGVYVGADDKNSSQNMLSLYQSGIGLPDRDYYFKTDAAIQAVVKSYKNYIQTLFKLTGDDSAAAAQKTTVVYNLEKQLAESHSTNVELRNVQANYNKIAVADLDKKMPRMGRALKN